MLVISTTRDHGCTVVHLDGEVDASNVVSLREALAAVTDEDQVVLEMSGVGFMDSAGLGAIIGFMRRLRQSGGNVALASARPPLRRLLHTAGLDRIVVVAETIDDAVAELRTGEAHPAATG